MASPFNNIQELFDRPLDRRIEEVIKVDQTNEDDVYNELIEYVVTDAIKQHYLEVLDHFWDTRQKPHEGIGVWISGFFGSGKSSFAKILGYILGGKTVKGRPAWEIFSDQAADDKIRLLLRQINEYIPTLPVIFDISTDRGVTSGSERITEIMYKVFLRELGYSDDLDLAELEIALEAAGRLDEFKERYEKMYGQTWEDGRDYIGFAKSEASAVMHEMDSRTYPQADTWALTTRNVDITPNQFAKRAFELLKKRYPNKDRIVFVVDEVGQYVSRSSDKMQDLQGLVQAFGRVGKGKGWIMVTSQEKLDEVVGSLDDKKIELARLIDRFPVKVDLGPADITEVTSRRLLTKKPDAEKFLKAKYNEVKGSLGVHTALEGTARRNDLNAALFAHLYPFLPYQIDLIIEVVSGLRRQPGASRHTGGSNRTIIKLAQQVIVHPKVKMGQLPPGELVTMDKVYELIEGNISYEKKMDIADIAKNFSEKSIVLKVAKTICLLQFVKNLPRTAENIAAVLYPNIEQKPLVKEVQEALEILLANQKIRLGEEGYELLTAEGKLWEERRQGFRPNTHEEKTLKKEIMEEIIKPLKPYRHRDLKNFMPAVELEGEKLGREGEVPLVLNLAEEGEQYRDALSKAREESRLNEQAVFWVVPLGDRIYSLLTEAHRSKMMIRDERNYKSVEEGRLLAEEKKRLGTLQTSLKALMTAALLDGSTYFRGVQRDAKTLGDNIQSALNGLMEIAVPAIFTKFDMGAVSLKGNEPAELLTATNLTGLPAVVYEGTHGLGLVTKKGHGFNINLEAGVVREIRDFINKKHRETGQQVSGKALESHFRGIGYGWELELIMLATAALFRGAAIEMHSQGRRYRSHGEPGAKEPFDKIPLFRSAGFTPRQDSLTLEDLVNAVQAFQEIYGETLEIEEEAIAGALRKKFAAEREIILPLQATLRHNGLPWADNLEQVLNTLKGIRESASDDAVKVFAGQREAIREALEAVRGIQAATTPDNLKLLQKARVALKRAWPVLKDRVPDEKLAGAARRLNESLNSETFYQRMASIASDANIISGAYIDLYCSVMDRRTEACRAVLEELRNRGDWIEISTEARRKISAPFEARMRPDGCPESEMLFDPSVELMEADLMALDNLRRQALAELERLTMPEVRIERLSVRKFVQGSLSGQEDLDLFIKRLREHCMKLFAEGARVIIE
ncbi:MAG: BREX system P-loop protein BrxC [Peptococcaceae bacterium]|nr:BREX system P-loop protein BrxC [Peptococcaceae bacterium]